MPPNDGSKNPYSSRYLGKNRIRPGLHEGKYGAHPCCLHARCNITTSQFSVPTLQVTTCQQSSSCIFCVPCCMFRSSCSHFHTCFSCNSHVHILCTCGARALRHRVSIRLEQVPGVQLASLQAFQIRNSIAQLLTFTRTNFRTLSALSHVSKPFFLGFRKASSCVQVMSHVSHVSHVHLLQDLCIFVYSVHLFSFFHLLHLHLLLHMSPEVVL